MLASIFAAMFINREIRICFTVTNDLSYDQRMQRICRSLAKNGYSVTLIGREKKNSLHLNSEIFHQKRLFCFLQKGLFFYIEFNIRLLIALIFTRFDIVCAIDLDTILPCYFSSAIKNKKRVYDAHELFTEQKEIVTRKNVHAFWKMIEAFALPRFKNGYTVNGFIQNEFQKKYGVDYAVIRNMPEQKEYSQTVSETNNPLIIYQGAVNEGRSFETIIPAMQDVDGILLIYGDGNFFSQAQQLITANHLSEKIFLKGSVLPDELKQITPTARFGLMIFENLGLNQYQSLSNRFFDYIMAGIPQICVAYPEYKKINQQYEIALMIENTDPKTISTAMNKLLHDDVLYQQLKNNCIKASAILNWEHEEEQKLIAFYQKI